MTDTSDNQQPEESQARANGRDAAARNMSAMNSNGADPAAHRANGAARADVVNGAVVNGAGGSGRGFGRERANGSGSAVQSDRVPSDGVQGNGVQGNGVLGNGVQGNGVLGNGAQDNRPHAQDNRRHANGRAVGATDDEAGELFGPAATTEVAHGSNGAGHPDVGGFEVDDADNSFGVAVERLGQTVEAILPTLDVHREELVAAAVANRFAVLIDGPRTELLLDAAERSRRAPEELLIEILDRFFDSES